jgi:hypothetical protein
MNWKRRGFGLPRDHFQRRKQARMETPDLLDRIDSLIDDLLNDSNLSSSSLASILMAARESVRGGYHVALARRLWEANNELRLRIYPEDSALGETPSSD